MIRPADPPNDDGKPNKPSDKDADPFGPPEQPVEVGCLHCGGIFMSDQITWRIEPDHEGKPLGLWCCPDPTCDGAGFGIDLLPTDPNYQDEYGGWVYDDDEEDEEDYEDDDLDPFNDNTPDSFEPPKDWTGNDDDDIPF